MLASASDEKTTSTVEWMLPHFVLLQPDLCCLREDHEYPFTRASRGQCMQKTVKSMSLARFLLSFCVRWNKASACTFIAGSLSGRSQRRWNDQQVWSLSGTTHFSVISVATQSVQKTARTYTMDPKNRCFLWNLKTTSPKRGSSFWFPLPIDFLIHLLLWKRPWGNVCLHHFRNKLQINCLNSFKVN